MADTLTPENGDAKRARIGGALDRRRGSNFMEPQLRRCSTWPVSKLAVE